MIRACIHFYTLYKAYHAGHPDPFFKVTGEWLFFFFSFFLFLSFFVLFGFGFLFVCWLVVEFFVGCFVGVVCWVFVCVSVGCCLFLFVCCGLGGLFGWLVACFGLVSHSTKITLIPQ